MQSHIADSTLAVGEKEITDGEGHTLTSVFKEADALLRGGNS
jgi:hypothetical protein